MDAAIEENSAAAFRLALAGWDPQKDDRLVLMLAERNRLQLFQLFATQRTVAAPALAHLVRLDRGHFLLKMRLPADEEFRLALLWECFQHNAQNCFQVAMRGAQLDAAGVRLLNQWLYDHAAHRILPLLVGRRLFRPEQIREGLLSLRGPALPLLETLLPYLAHFDSPDLLVEMIERKQYWFIKFYALHVRGVCRNRHALFERFAHCPDVSMHLRAFCRCAAPWVPNDLRIEAAANWQHIEDFHLDPPLQ